MALNRFLIQHLDPKTYFQLAIIEVKKRFGKNVADELREIVSLPGFSNWAGNL